jgi:DNA polymerase
MNQIEELYLRKKECTSCGLRSGCTQVVTGTGQTDSPILLVIGEAPGQDEDLAGEPFIGRAGQLLREVIRETKILNRHNTLISNVLGCRPPKNKFPTDESPSVCVSKWLLKEIEIAKPERMLLIGGQALWHVAGIKKITMARGQWYDIKGIRTMATFHPSYVLRCEGEGKMQIRKMMEEDVMEIATEVMQLETKRSGK